MKKIISLILAFILISTFCAPAFAAEDEPEEWKSSKGLYLEPLVKGVYVEGSLEEWAPIHIGGGVSHGKNYIIRSGEYTVETIVVRRDCTLTIGGNANVTITDLFANSGDIIVAGTLDLTNCDVLDSGTIYIADCCAKFSTGEAHLKNVIHVAHCFENGTCIGCGYVCENEFHNGVYACRDCGMEIDLSQGNSLVSSSTLSEGNLAIITAVVGAAVGMAAMFFIMKKKQPALVNVVEKETKDEE